MNVGRCVAQMAGHGRSREMKNGSALDIANQEHRSEIARRTTDDDPYTFRIDSEIADQIVLKWMLRHLKYAEDVMVHDTAHPEDKAQAEADIKVYRRVLHYITGDWSYA